MGKISAGVSRAGSRGRVFNMYDDGDQGGKDSAASRAGGEGLVAQPRCPTDLDGRVCVSGRRKGGFRDSQRMTRQCRTCGQGSIRDSFAKLALNISKARQMGISTACFDLKLDALLMFTNPFSSSSSSSSSSSFL